MTAPDQDFRRAALVLALAALAPLAESAAQPALTKLTLSPPSGSHPEEFTGITSVRELSDGRVLVTDGREQRLLVLDFRDGSARPIGRKGGGPNEYGMVFHLHATAGDSSLMYDLTARRLLLFDRDRIVVTVPPDDPAVKQATGAVWGADALGRLLTRWTSPRPDGESVTGKEDSTRLVLIDRRTGRADTVARTRNRPMRTQIAKNAEGRVTSSSMMSVGVLPLHEESALFNDGTLVIARVEPFRIDRRSPDGKWTLGAPLPLRPIRMDARERAAFLERNAANYKPNPSIPPQFQQKPPAAGDFPEFIPPFASGAAPLRGPGGTILIRRSRSAAYPDPTYLVIDRHGRLVGEFTLKSTEQLVGASHSTLYVAWKDEDDVQRLRRHPWPDTP